MFWENIMAMWLVSSFSSTEFPLIGPGGWQHPHLCPDAFKTLAGRGRPITEGGQSSSAFSVGRAVRAGEVAPATTLAHLGEQQRLSRPEGCLWQHCCRTSFKGMLVLKLRPRGDPACVGCQMSLCWRKGGRWFESAAPFQGAALHLGQGFHPELLPPWATGNTFQGIESWGWEGARGWAVRGRTARLSRRGLVRMSLEALTVRSQFYWRVSSGPTHPMQVLGSQAARVQWTCGGYQRSPNLPHRVTKKEVRPKHHCRVLGGGQKGLLKPRWLHPWISFPLHQVGQEPCLRWGVLGFFVAFLLWVVSCLSTASEVTARKSFSIGNFLQDHSKTGSWV